jgi:signal transduction histidine kinase
LVELHGGCLEIESEPNRGSQVIVRLPAKKHHPETDQEDGLHEKIA